MEGAVLNVRFRRLYELSENKLTTVREMKTVSGGRVGEAWNWGRMYRPRRIM
jgi:hypothetical protein